MRSYFIREDCPLLVVGKNPVLFERLRSGTDDFSWAFSSVLDHQLMSALVESIV